MVSYKRLSIPFQLLSWYLVFNFLDNVANRIVISLYGNNLVILHIETLANLVFFSLIYNALFKNKYMKMSVLIFLILGILLYIINFLFIQPYNKVFPSTMLLFNELLFVAYSMVLFKQMLQYPLQINITQQSLFWYNTAILFFYSTMVVNFALINYYYTHNFQSNIESYFWYFSDITFNLLLGFAVFMDRETLYRVAPLKIYKR